MSAVNLNWQAEGNIDSYSIYRSELPIDINSLPTPIATGIVDMFYSDTDVVVGKSYHYRVASLKNNAVMISSEITISTVPKPLGLWVASFSENPASIEGNSFNINGNHDVDWVGNFGKTSQFSVSAYGLGTGLAENRYKTIQKKVTGRTFSIYSKLSYNVSDSCGLDLAFKNLAGNVIFNLKVAVSGAASLTLSYGSNSSALTAAPALSPSFGFGVDGILEFLPNKVKFTPHSSVNTNGAFEFFMDTTQIESVYVNANFVYRSFNGDKYKIKQFFKCVS